MPLGGGHAPLVLDTAKALVSNFHGLLETDEHAKLQELDLRSLEGGHALQRGVFATAPLPKGSTVMVIPKRLQVTEQDTESARFRGASSDNSAVRFGLWLAEKRAASFNSVQAPATDMDRYWTSYIRHLPTLEQHEAQGLPVSGPERDLHRLEGLPKVGLIARAAMKWRDTLGQALSHYNAIKGTRAKLNWEDALWGFSSVISRAFECTRPLPDGNKPWPILDGGAQIVTPVADLLNHSSQPNVEVYCDPTNNDMKLVTTHDIKADEELTVDYQTGFQSDRGLSLVSNHGMLESEGGIPEDAWGTEDCAKLRDEHLGQGADGPMLRLVGKLVDHYCPSPAEASHANGSSPHSVRPPETAQEGLQATRTVGFGEVTHAEPQIKILSASSLLVAIAPLSSCIRVKSSVSTHHAKQQRFRLWQRTSLKNFF